MQKTARKLLQSFTPHTRAVFLDVLKMTGNVTYAAEQAGVSRKTAYNEKERNPDFAANWDELLQEACDRLEREAWRRAVDGCDRPVYQGGKEVGVIREFSDTLMVALLKAHRPEKYRENSTIKHEGELHLKRIELTGGTA